MTTSIHSQVHAEIDRCRDEIVTFLSDLVRFPSVNRRPFGDELECQLWLDGYYRERAFEVDLFRPDEVPGIETNPGWWPDSDFTDRPNVVATRRGSGGSRSLLYLAHVDVVPEGPHELWRHGPFNPTIEDGALVGRGAADDKSGIAAQTMALLCLESAGFRPKGDVILASVVDEESAGANGTLATLLRPHIADASVYTDGLGMEIHIAQLGGINFEIEVQYNPDSAGVTIDHIMEVMPALYEEMQAFARQRRAEIAADPRYSETSWPDYAVRISLLQAGSYDHSNPGAGRLHASAYILPGESIEGMQQRIDSLVAGVAARFGDRILPPRVSPVGRIMPPSAIDPNDPFVTAVGESFTRATGQTPRLTGMPMSDLFQFLLYSPQPMPTVAMGAARWGGRGGVHEPNESILIDEHLIPFTKTLASLIIDWCGVEPA